MTNVVTRESAEDVRDAFLEFFDPHDRLTEREMDIFEVENIPEDSPAEYTRQRVIAAYDRVHVWLLNDDGPLQAYYDDGGEFGEPGGADEVADEIERRLNL